MVWYFAYGSNMSEARMQERQVSYTARTKGELEGYRLCFNKRASSPAGHGYANVEPDPGSIVKGVLYCIDANGLANLDVNEGVQSNNYTRQVLPVRMDTGEVVNAQIYIAHPSRIADGLIVDDKYLEKVMAGKDLWGGLFAAEVRLAAQGRAVPVEAVMKMEVGTELPVLIDGVKARIGFVNAGWSERLSIVFEEAHPTQGLEPFVTKYFEMNQPGCMEWGHFGECFAVQYRE